MGKLDMKVLVADDHPIVRSSLAQVLALVDTDVRVIEASNFGEALDCAAKHRDVDLILLDLRMPGMPPFDGLRELVAMRPDIPLVVVSAVDNREDALRAIEYGAMGYIPKTIAPEEFENLLRRVISGQIAMPRSLLERDATRMSSTLDPFGDPASRDRIFQLTRRQQEVLKSLSHGKSNLQIAQDLGLSEKTVRLHVSAILKTLNLSNRTQAALLAARSLQPDHLDAAEG